MWSTCKARCQKLGDDHLADPCPVRLKVLVALRPVIDLPARIYQHRFAVRKRNEGRIALPYVEQIDPQLAVGSEPRKA